MFMTLRFEKSKSTCPPYPPDPRPANSRPLQSLPPHMPPLGYQSSPPPGSVPGPQPGIQLGPQSGHQAEPQPEPRRGSSIVRHQSPHPTTSHHPEISTASTTHNTPSLKAQNQKASLPLPSRETEALDPLPQATLPQSQRKRTRLKLNRREDTYLLRLCLKRKISYDLPKHETAWWNQITADFNKWCTRGQAASLARHVKQLVSDRELQLDMLGSDEKDEKGPYIEAIDKWITVVRKVEKKRLKAFRKIGEHDEWTKILLQRNRSKQQGREEVVISGSDEECETVGEVGQTGQTHGSHRFETNSNTSPAMSSTSRPRRSESLGQWGVKRRRSPSISGSSDLSFSSSDSSSQRPQTKRARVEDSISTTSIDTLTGAAIKLTQAWVNRTGQKAGDRDARIQRLDMDAQIARQDLELAKQYREETKEYREDMVTQLGLMEANLRRIQEEMKQVREETNDFRDGTKNKLGLLDLKLDSIREDIKQDKEDTNKFKELIDQKLDSLVSLLERRRR